MNFSEKRVQDDRMEMFHSFGIVIISFFGFVILFLSSRQRRDLIKAHQEDASFVGMTKQSVFFILNPGFSKLYFPLNAQGEGSFNTYLVIFTHHFNKTPP
jgi:hypothetical protein